MYVCIYACRQGRFNAKYHICSTYALTVSIFITCHVYYRIRYCVGNQQVSFDHTYPFSVATLIPNKISPYATYSHVQCTRTYRYFPLLCMHFIFTMSQPISCLAVTASPPRALNIPPSSPTQNHRTPVTGLGEIPAILHACYKNGSEKNKLLVRRDYKTNISHNHRSTTIASVFYIAEMLFVQTLMCGRRTPYYTFRAATLIVFKN
jgi:hypothetical protein